MSPLKKGAKLTNKPKDFMLRTRLDEETLEKLDYSAKKFGLSRSEVVRNGIYELWLSLEYSKERKMGMKSFTDVNGNVVPFSDVSELTLELQTDIETDDVTAYLVWAEEHVYEVSKKTYQAIESKK